MAGDHRRPAGAEAAIRCLMCCEAVHSNHPETDCQWVGAAAQTVHCAVGLPVRHVDHCLLARFADRCLPHRASESLAGPRFRQASACLARNLAWRVGQPACPISAGIASAANSPRCSACRPGLNPFSKSSAYQTWFLLLLSSLFQVLSYCSVLLPRQSGVLLTYVMRLSPVNVTRIIRALLVDICIDKVEG